MRGVLGAVLAGAAICATPAPVGAQEAPRFTLHMGASIPLVTDQPLSSKTSAKGDMVRLRTAADVIADGHVLIPKDTPAVGQISAARAKGAMGMSGQLAIRPLYIRIGDSFVRLGGAASEKGTITAGAVVGIAVLTPGFTGRSATIPAGTALEGFVERAVDLPAIR